MSISLLDLQDGTLADAAAVMANFNALRQAIEEAATGAAVGDLRFTAIPVVASGWLAGLGQPVSRTTYKALWEVCGTHFGAGDGETTFNVPNFCGRVLLGAGSGAGLTPRTIGEMIGEEAHKLTAAELAAHNHTAQQEAHDHGIFNFYTESNFPIGGQELVNGGGGVWSTQPSIGFHTNTYGATTQANTGITDSKTPGVSTNDAGSDIAHNNMQPSTVCYVWIKY